MNNELIITLLKFFGAMVVIMAVIAFVTVLTPRLAKLIDRHRKNSKKPLIVGDDENEAKGIYDAQKEEDFDPNYKIYNEDIYGLNFKSNKKRK